MSKPLGEGFYLNNVKYVGCEAAEGAAIMNRSKGHYLLQKFGCQWLRMKEDFDIHRGWIFADRDTTEYPEYDVNSLSPKRSQDPGRNAECTAKFRSTVKQQVQQDLRVFSKLRICLVEMSNNRKPELKRKIENNGGKILMDLIKNKVDILLVTDCTSIHFKNARLWGIACINPEWIDKSVREAKLLPLDKFQVYDGNVPRISITRSEAPSTEGLSRKLSHTTSCVNFHRKDLHKNKKNGLRKSKTHSQSKLSLSTRF